MKVLVMKSGILLEIIFLLAVTTLVGCLNESKKKQGRDIDVRHKEKPNVILFYADDLGRGLLSGEGQEIIKTPNIDRLAQEGMRFENAYGCMLCAPARASLLTGYHDCNGERWKISRGGIYRKISEGSLSTDEVESKLNDQIGTEPENEVFLAEVFKNAGYVTGEIGKLEWGFASTNRQMKRHGWEIQLFTKYIPG